MTKTAFFAVFVAVATSVWTWWPRPVEVAQTVDAREQVLTASGSPVDPARVAGIRVVTVDPVTDTAIPFEVKRNQGTWTIPSHFDYPADGGTRVGETAGAVLNLKLGPLVTNDKGAHGVYGVVDPLAAEIEGSPGKRVTLTDEGGAVLVDVIIGKQQEETTVFFVRRANESQVYTAKVQPEKLKVAFKDWVETNLLKVAQSEIIDITVRDYSVDEASGRLNQRSTVIANRVRRNDPSKAQDQDEWALAPAVPGKKTKLATLESITQEAAGLTLVGVRPFSPMWLQERGFYMGATPDGQKQLYGNEGEVQVVTGDGLVHHLYFGEIALGDAEDQAPKTDAKVGSNESPNRYMAIFVQYDPMFDKSLPKPIPADQPAAVVDPASGAEASPVQRPPKNQAEIGEAMAEGARRAAKAQQRFEKFFYVVSDASFRTLRPSRDTFYEDATPQ